MSLSKEILEKFQERYNAEGRAESAVPNGDGELTPAQIVEEKRREFAVSSPDSLLLQDFDALREAGEKNPVSIAIAKDMMRTQQARRKSV